MTYTRRLCRRDERSEYTLTHSRTTGTWQALDSDGKLVAEADTMEALEAFMWSHGWKPVEAHND